MIEVVNVTKRFGGLVAVNKMNIVVEKSEILGLIGPNGAGKTTLFNCIAGYFKVDDGLIKLDKKNITNLSSEEICKNGIARTFQAANPWNLTVVKNYGGLLIIQEKTKHALKRRNLYGITGIFHLAMILQKILLSAIEKMEMMQGSCYKTKEILFDEVMAV